MARDPAGWERRILSPVLPGVEFEFMRTTLGPGVDAGVFLPHAPGSREYVAISRHAPPDDQRHALHTGCRRQHLLRRRLPACIRESRARALRVLPGDGRLR